MGNGGTVEEGDHSAIAILVMPRETPTSWSFHNQYYPPVEGGAEMAVGPKVQRSKNPKTADRCVRLSVRVGRSGISDIGECTAGRIDTAPDHRRAKQPLSSTSEGAYM